MAASLTIVTAVQSLQIGRRKSPKKIGKKKRNKIGLRLMDTKIINNLKPIKTVRHPSP